jgi:hypothetical protein
VKGIVILTRIARLASSVNNVQALKQSLDVSEFLNPVRTTAGIPN